MKTSKPCLQCGETIQNLRKNKTFCGELCRENYIEDLTEKTCKDCGEVKSISEFTRKKGNFDRLDTTCKACVHLKWKEWYHDDEGTAKAKNAEANRKAYATLSDDQKLSNRVSKYGLTVEQFGELVIRSNGMCEICKTKPFEAIDHCHSSGKVRGLLCGHCNRSLGGFKDSIEVLQNAIDYVRINSNDGTTKGITWQK